MFMQNLPFPLFQGTINAHSEQDFIMSHERISRSHIYTEIIICLLDLFADSSCQQYKQQ